jgi:hypothetical protein
MVPGQCPLVFLVEVCGNETSKGVGIVLCYGQRKEVDQGLYYISLVRVPDYRSSDPGSDCRRHQIF